MVVREWERPVSLMISTFFLGATCGVADRATISSGSASRNAKPCDLAFQAEKPTILKSTQPFVVFTYFVQTYFCFYQYNNRVGPATTQAKIRFRNGPVCG